MSDPDHNNKNDKSKINYCNYKFNTEDKKRAVLIWLIYNKETYSICLK